MGVNGLWNVIQPCARPTNLATLNRKRLAVDASIWIYQFLKAVRDKEGNALRNSHVVGFFRRICKLLWFGIRPVFVFDGGAPALKRQTIAGRKRRREGRREDAVRTAGKLLAVQMQRIAEDDADKRRRRLERERQADTGPDPQTEHAEELPDESRLVYVDELGMDQQERQKSRKFFKQDAYHLPEMDRGIEGMGKPEDPRIMSIDELEEYARQFNSGEDINLYDFSKIDFEGEFFKSLPPADRYNILNAARMRSRLRMGHTKEQLDDMFPDRMAFSRFQIERVKERNHLTQRLMQEAGMTGTDLTLGVNARVAGEKDREYILVRNEGAEGGWALGVVSKERDRGEIHKPIDVDALDFQFQPKEEDCQEDEEDFEDVPIQGLNRLPRPGAHHVAETSENEVAPVEEEDNSLFVGGDFSTAAVDGLFGSHNNDANLANDEEEDVNRAIEMSMRNQHQGDKDEDEDVEFEDVPAPEWNQQAVAKPKPVTSASGSMIAHIVNNRANAAVPKRKAVSADSDSDDDLKAALNAARKKMKTAAASRPVPPPAPAANVKNPFDGPLPFEKLSWKAGLSASQKTQSTKKPQAQDSDVRSHVDDEMAGGFERAEDAQSEAGGFLVENEDEETARPLPPWMIPDEGDIRDKMKEQRELEDEMNAADRQAAEEEARRRKKDAIIEIESSDEGSDVEVVDPPPAPAQRQSTVRSTSPAVAPRLSPATQTKLNPPEASTIHDNEDTRNANALQGGSESATEIIEKMVTDPKPTEVSPQPQAGEDANRQDDSAQNLEVQTDAEESPEPDFEDVSMLQHVQEPGAETALEPQKEPEEPQFEVIADPTDPAAPPAVPGDPQDVVFGEDDDEFSDPEEEELLTQMAQEAEEHARFASSLNQKSEQENIEAYEQELKALRNQQKKDRRDADEVTQIMITECQALLRFFGIPYITAPMEAEAQCAELVDQGLVDGIVTDDSDIFLFGGTRVYKNMFNSNKFVECYLGKDLEKELSLSREQLISIAQLLGSDYTEGLPGIGPVSAVEILSEFPGREGMANFREWWTDVQVHNRPKEADKDSVFRRKFRRSQGTKLFLPPSFPNPAVFDAYLQPDVDRSPQPFEWGVPDVDGLRRFLMSTIGWSQERTDEVLVPVVRDMNRREIEGTQSNITRFFEGSVGTGTRRPTGQASGHNGGDGGAPTNQEAFAPRQRVQSSKRMKEAVNKLRANKVVEDLAPAPFEDPQPEAGASNTTAATGTGRTTKRNAQNPDGSGRDEGLEADGDGDGDYHASDGAGDGSSVSGTTRKGRGKGKAASRGNKATRRS